MMPPTSEQQQERRVKQWQTPITICNNDCHQYKNSSQSANSNSNYTILYKRPNATATNPLLNCSKLLATLDRELTLEQIIPTNQMEWMEIQRFQEILFPVRYNQQFYENLQNNMLTCCLVIRRNQRQLVACTTGRVTIEPIPITASTCTTRLGYIMTLGVVEEWRKRGLATQLLTRLVKYLQTVMHADSVELDVLSENRAAVRLYLRMGFEITRCLPEFYKINGQLKDAYHMRFHHND